MGKKLFPFDNLGKKIFAFGNLGKKILPVITWGRIDPCWLIVGEEIVPNWAI